VSPVTFHLRKQSSRTSPIALAQTKTPFADTNNIFSLPQWKQYQPTSGCRRALWKPHAEARTIWFFVWHSDLTAPGRDVLVRKHHSHFSTATKRGIICHAKTPIINHRRSLRNGTHPTSAADDWRRALWRWCDGDPSKATTGRRSVWWNRYCTTTSAAATNGRVVRDCGSPVTTRTGRRRGIWAVYSDAACAGNRRWPIWAICSNAACAGCRRWPIWAVYSDKACPGRRFVWANSPLPATSPCYRGAFWSFNREHRRQYVCTIDGEYVSTTRWWLIVRSRHAVLFFSKS